VRTSRKGDGPALHHHPYSETFILQSGRAECTVGDRELVGSAGQIIIVPAYTSHKFANADDKLLTMINIHASDHFITEWL
jgi:mannose-6-phosphate isomerase-like protein (cupin superfamily)